MSAAAPWSVKGIDPKAREIAKDLARRSGMTLGEWLNSMIMEDDDDGGVVPLGRRPHVMDTYERRGRSRRLDDAYQMEEQGWDRIGASVDAIAARLEAAERRSTTAIQGVDQAVTGLLRRLDEQDKSASALTRRIDDVAEELREGHRRLRRFEQETGPSTQEAFGKVEKGLQAITGRLLEVEDRQGRTAEDLRRRIEAVEKVAPGNGTEVLGEVGRRLDAAQGQTADALRRLEASFAQLDRRLHATESRVEPEGAREAARFEKLAETLSRQVEANRAEMMRRMDAAEAEGRMDRIERAVLAIGEQVKSSEQKSAQGIEAMGREVLRIGQNLHGRVQVVEREGARQAQALEQRQAAAEDRHALALEKLGVEITRISDRLTDRIAQSERKSAQAIEEIGRRLAEGTGRLEQRHDRTSGELAERLRQSEERTAKLLAEAREAMETRTAATPEPRPVPVPEPAARPEAIFAPIPEGPVEPSPAQADWRAAAFPDLDLGLDDPFTATAGPAFEAQAEPTPETAARPFAAPLEPVLEAPAAAPEPAPQSAEAPVPGPFGRVAAGGFGGADVTDALAATAPDFGHHEFAAETDFVDPRALRAAAQAGRASSTRATIDQARAAMATPAADEAPARGAFGLKKGGKSRLQERLDRQASGSTVRKALGASAVAVALTGGLYGFARVQGVEAPWAALTGQGTDAAAPATLALATTDAVPATTPEQRAEGARLFGDAVAALDADDLSGVDTLRRAAELGHPPAQLMMAGLYETGDAGLASDMTQARSWIRRAAESGDARGMFGYGMYLFEGQGGPQDRAGGFEWILKAAEAGLVDAQFNAGLILKTGEAGAPADPAEAYRWLLIAARGGDVQAREEAQTLAPTLTEAQRAEARQSAADFQTGTE
ncbi:MAG: SEL1-like repeat protein [Alphaproteobacteria bacterium]|nr:SEL1-like repeat protein [Alphaproteobacteria bacterium]MBU1527324.1 SEL1-like repeat protein [Alphaproteobacteria bacterium]MBU2352324.1 SEL1-like repeat protein [Alphaproteobacteria bacterium]